MRKPLYRRIFSYISRQKAAIFGTLALSVLYVALSLAVPVFVGRFIDGLSQGARYSLVPLLLIGVCSLLAALAQWCMSHLNNLIASNVLRDLRADALKKVQKLPFSYLDRTPAGDIVSRVMTDADSFSDGLLMGFTQLFTGVLTVVVTIVFMLRMNWRVTLAVVLLTPLSIVISRLVAGGIYRHFSRQAQARAEISAYTDEMVTGRNTVRVYGREDAVCREFAAKNERLRRISGKALFLSSLTNPTTRFINALVYAAVALIGALLCLSQGGEAMTVGMLASFLAYANRYTGPFNEISGVAAELQNARACAERIFDFLDEEEETPDTPSPLPITQKGYVGAEHVFFSYEPDEKLIEDFNLQVKPGQRIAVVGPTGCGKTTLINLLMRFYDPVSGRMTKDGEDLRDYRRRDLRRSYGMVLQENWIGKGTVADNIRRGKPGATMEEVIAAATAAHAHGFIVRLPKGYDTVLEENGEGLSAGQRQLICIAAVMLVDPPMLILDEATASIDTRTEMKIQDAFSKLMEGRTSFIVAHRLSTVTTADLILVMKNGRIVESGRHEELLEKGGFYSELYNAQFA